MQNQKMTFQEYNVRRSESGVLPVYWVLLCVSARKQNLEVRLTAD